MNLYKVSQDVNKEYGTYDSAVVCAASEDEARMMKPECCGYDEEWDGKIDELFHDWCAAKDVKVEFIGIAKEGSVKSCLCSSFNAG